MCAGEVRGCERGVTRGSVCRCDVRIGDMSRGGEPEARQGERDEMT